MTRKLSTGLIWAVVIASTLVITVNYYFASRIAASELERRADEMIRNLVKTLELPLWHFDNETIKEIGSAYAVNEIVMAFKVTDSHSRVLVHINKKTPGTPVIRKRDVLHNGVFNGSVYIALSQQYYQVMNQRLLASSAMTVAVVILTLIIASRWLLRSYLRKPLDHLQNTVNAYGTGAAASIEAWTPCTEFESFVSVLSDMGEKIRSQMDDLRQAEEKYRAIFENAVEGLFQADADFRFIHVNPAFASALGYGSPEHLTASAPGLGKELFKDPKDWEALYGRLQSDGHVIGYEARILRKDGAEIWAVISVRLISKDEDTAYEGSLVDITKRKEAEEGLKRLLEVIENTSDLVAIATKDQRLTFMNGAGRRLLGWDMDFEHAPRRIQNTHPKWAYDLIHAEGIPAAVEEGIWEGETAILGGAGEEIPVSQVIMSHKGENGEVQVFSTIIRDISEIKQAQDERRKLEAKLLQSQKLEAVGTLAGGIAHDFNNILGGILGYSQLAQLARESGKDAGEYLQQIITASERARDLVQQILTFSRQSKTEKIPCDISMIIKEGLKLLRASLPSNVEINENIQTDIGAVVADQTQIQQVLMNLCTNAFHAIGTDNGRIDIDLAQVELKRGDPLVDYETPPGPYLRLSVSDNGSGMDKATVSRVFEPYFTTKKVGEGTGLGLATAHGIIKDHQGAIAVYSEPGKGTTFHIFLPVVEHAVKIEQESKEDLPWGTERILFVDDEEILVEIGESMLSLLGYSVVCSSSPLEALELFKAAPDQYDLVITDMTMPQMTGNLLAVELKKVRPDIPVILSTGFSYLLNSQSVKEAGISDVLMKPLSIQRLADSVRRSLDKG
jgi:PAS domain S-box-containing protein